MTTEVARGLNLRKLMSHAFLVLAVEQQGDRTRYPASTVDALEAVRGPIRRRREPLTGDRVREVAEVYWER